MSPSTQLLLGVFVLIAAAFVAGVLVSSHRTAPPDPAAKPLPPELWVGVTRFEGKLGDPVDELAAEKAYVQLQSEEQKIPGTVELMHGTRRVRFFRVV